MPIADKANWYEDTRKERLGVRPLRSEFVNDWLMIRRKGIYDPAGIIELARTLPMARAQDDDARNCDVIDLKNHREMESVRALDGKIFSSFSDAMMDYAAENPFMQISSDEGYNILRYKPGEGCLIHSDTWHRQDVSKRVLSGLIYLNSDFEGGELVFRRQGITVKPEAGMIVLFPSTFAFPHEVNPVRSGERWTILTWMGVL